MEPGDRVWNVPAAHVGLACCERAVVLVPRTEDPRVFLTTQPPAIALEARPERLGALSEHAAAADLAAGMLAVRPSPDEELRASAAELVALRARVVLAPRHAPDVARLALSGVMVELRDLWAWTLAVAGPLADALELYLSHPELEVPIEPFHGLARGMGRREGLSLRAIAREVVRRDWRLTEGGMVTISERHEQEGAFLGRLEDGDAAWRSSDVWRAAEGRERTHFLERTPCAVCEHWLACGGYGARDGTVADPTWCAAWMPLFARLRSAFALAVGVSSEAASADYPG